jgi:hypothetical protein
MNTKTCDVDNECGDMYCEQCCAHPEIEDSHCLLCGKDMSERQAAYADHYLNGRDD